MIRRLNFTGRKRIARGDVTVRLEPSGDRFLVAVTASLAAYALPPSARLYAEAYRQMRWQRFDCGTVAEPTPKEPLVLKGFGTSQGVRFRLKVVEPEGAAPRILALADQIRPVVPAASRGGMSLLPVDWALEGELRRHAWKLELDEMTGPILRVSRSLVPDRDAFVGSKEFISLVLPSVLRRVLEAALAARESDGDEDGWSADWLRLARELPGVGAPPARRGDSAASEDEEEWLDGAVEAFAAKSAVGDRLAAWWNATS